MSFVKFNSVEDRRLDDQCPLSNVPQTDIENNIGQIYCFLQIVYISSYR